MKFLDILEAREYAENTMDRAYEKRERFKVMRDMCARGKNRWLGRYIYNNRKTKLSGHTNTLCERI